MRQQLSLSLNAVLSQRLLHGREGGLVLAMELLMLTPTLEI